LCTKKENMLLLWAISPTTFLDVKCKFCVMDSWLFLQADAIFGQNRHTKIILFCYTTKAGDLAQNEKCSYLLIRKKCENDFYKRDCHLCEKFAA